MKTIAALLVLAVGAMALTNPPITGPTPPPVQCPNELCADRVDGNYEHELSPNHFLQCVGGLAYCQPCWPISLVFSQRCNQCMYNKHDPCYTTKSWIPEKRYPCPDLCPKKGRKFNGNIQDPAEQRHYVGCWEGMTMGCVNCPSGLLYNEKWNACLYDGKHFTKPLYD